MDRNAIKAIALDNTKAFVESRIKSLEQMTEILTSVNADTRQYQVAIEELQGVIRLISKLEAL